MQDGAVGYGFCLASRLPTLNDSALYLSTKASAVELHSPFVALFWANTLNDTLNGQHRKVINGHLKKYSKN